jgi:hypothetical protein
MEAGRASPGGPAGPCHWAVRFISGKYQGSEYPLEPGREITVGRASSADMVLAEDMVSRNHAKLCVSGDEVVIQDLGSTNGTFVNGDRVNRCALKDGDRILIGTSILKVVRLASPVLPVQRRGEPAQAPEVVSTLRPRALKGDIHEHGLSSLLQLLVQSKHSGVLVIQGPRTARLFFREGQLLRVELDGLVEVTGKKALWRIFTWTSGPFQVKPLPEDVEREFEEPTEALLAEATQQAEEIQRLQERLPPGANSFEIVRPLGPPLKDLSPKRLDTMQLVLNHGELETILDRNPVSDLDTYRHILFLLQKGYIQITHR